jgi:hypothetical protein
LSGRIDRDLADRPLRPRKGRQPMIIRIVLGGLRRTKWQD